MPVVIVAVVVPTLSCRGLPLARLLDAGVRSIVPVLVVVPLIVHPIVVVPMIVAVVMAAPMIVAVVMAAPMVMAVVMAAPMVMAVVAIVLVRISHAAPDLRGSVSRL